MADRWNLGEQRKNNCATKPWAQGTLVFGLKLLIFPIFLVLAFSSPSHSHEPWQFNRTFTPFSFPSLFIPIFSLFWGFEIPIRLVLLTTFPRYSLNLKFASHIYSLPLILFHNDAVMFTDRNLCHFRFQLLNINL